MKFQASWKVKGRPQYAQCVAISTKAALREMIAPGVLIMGTPLAVGFLFGVSAVAGMLAGSLVTGGVSSDRVF